MVSLTLQCLSEMMFTSSAFYWYCRLNGMLLSLLRKQGFARNLSFYIVLSSISARSLQSFMHFNKQKIAALNLISKDSLQMMTFAM